MMSAAQLQIPALEIFDHPMNSINQAKIKICGVTSSDIAEYAVKHGADYIGIVFHPKSKRNIKDLPTAKHISLSTKCMGGTAIGVFVDQTTDEIIKICDYTDIKVVQLHGKTAKKDHHLLPEGIIRIFAVEVDEHGNYHLDADDIEKLNPKRDFLLFDNKIPGSGTTLSHRHFHYDGDFKYFIAGGLTCDNVINCINLLKPYGVDISSGVEKLPGSKNKNLINNFIERAANVG